MHITNPCPTYIPEEPIIEKKWLDISGILKRSPYKIVLANSVQIRQKIRKSISMMIVLWTEVRIENRYIRHTEKKYQDLLVKKLSLCSV